TLVMPDLRGYGDSDRPPAAADRAPYSKRAMAQDSLELMQSFGHARFFVCGHDRGGRVAHRLALDHPQFVARLMVLLIPPAAVPETLIGGDPQLFLRTMLGGWGSSGTDLFDPRAMAEYQRCFTPEAIHAMCEDYRAAAGIDLEHDLADADRRIECPMHVLWGDRGVVHRLFTPIKGWRERARGPVSGRPVPGGHYVAEELPEVLVEEMVAFFAGP